MQAEARVEMPAAISEPGIYQSLSREDYDRIDAANYSRLKHFARTPAHAREAIVHPKPPTDAMELGTAIHLAILEPERFAAEYVRAPKVDRRTTKGKAEWAEFEAAHPGRNYLTDEEWAQCEGMVEAVRAHELASQLLYGSGRNEVSIVWRDTDTQLLCKARLDRFTKFLGWSVVIDLKKAQDASEWAFARQVARLGYHVQTAFYLDGLTSLAPVNRRFLIVAVEPEPPHGIMIYELDEPSLAQGRQQYRRYLARYAQCRATNQWPCYEPGLYPLSLPKWALSGEMEIG